MQKFNFRLETLLKIRLRYFEQAQQRLAIAVQEHQRQEILLDNLLIKLEETTSDFSKARHHVLTIETLKYFQNYIDKLNGDITAQTIAVQIADQARRQCLTELEEAARNKKLVEKLKERRLNQYNDASLNEEQKFLDEIGEQLYSQKRESGT